MLSGLRDDLYVVVGNIDPQSKRATLRFHVNPLVSWLWIGVFVLLFGASVSLWPEVRFREVGVWGAVRALAGATTTILFSILLAASVAHGRSTDGVASISARSPLPALVGSPR